MLAHAKHFLKDASVASIAPTSSRCVKQIAAAINFKKAKLIVEYGPGDGALTKYIVEHMRPDAKLVLIETNKHFVSVLLERFKDPRVTVVLESAEKIIETQKDLGFHKVDYVVSGIPFSMIAPEIKDQIIRKTSLILKKKGKFIVYQSLTAIKGRMTLKRTLNKYFETTDHKSLLLNLPPLYVLECVVKQPS